VKHHERREDRKKTDRKLAGLIVLFGTGTGASSAIEQLIARRNVAKRIVGLVALDERH
jgi:hypothetical protein